MVDDLQEKETVRVAKITARQMIVVSIITAITSIIVTLITTGYFKSDDFDIKNYVTKKDYDELSQKYESLKEQYSSVEPHSLISKSIYDSLLRKYNFLIEENKAKDVTISQYQKNLKERELKPKTDDTPELYSSEKKVVYKGDFFTDPLTRAVLIVNYINYKSVLDYGNGSVASKSNDIIVKIKLTLPNDKEENFTVENGRVWPFVYKGRTFKLILGDANVEESKVSVQVIETR